VPGANEAHTRANDLSNLAVLCIRCHRRIEHSAVIPPPVSETQR
jgi:hypothetical protein